MGETNDVILDIQLGLICVGLVVNLVIVTVFCHFKDLSLDAKSNLILISVADAFYLVMHFLNFLLPSIAVIKGNVSLVKFCVKTHSVVYWIYHASRILRSEYV